MHIVAGKKLRGPRRDSYLLSGTFKMCYNIYLFVEFYLSSLDQAIDQINIDTLFGADAIAV